MTQSTPRQQFRVLSRLRNVYEGAVMYDIQLQVAATGALVWAQTFSDHEMAGTFRDQLEADLEDLDVTAFRRKYGVPSTA